MVNLFNLGFSFVPNQLKLRLSFCRHTLVCVAVGFSMAAREKIAHHFLPTAYGSSAAKQAVFLSFTFTTQILRIYTHTHTYHEDLKLTFCIYTVLFQVFYYHVFRINEFWMFLPSGRRTVTIRHTRACNTHFGLRVIHHTTERDVRIFAGSATISLATTHVHRLVSACVYLVGKAITAPHVSI